MQITYKDVQQSPVNNKPALVHIMAWPQTGNKPPSESLMA